MPRPVPRLTLLLSLAVIVALVAIATNAPPAAADRDQPVTVTNFPAVQQVAGRVVITAPVPQTKMEVRSVLVTPVEPTDTGRLVDGGAVDVSGFSFVTLSLAGNLQGHGERGIVGVMLVPEVGDVMAVLRNFGVVQFPLRNEATVPPSLNGAFNSESVTFRLAFPRYRVLLYNSSPKTAEATVYAYLSTS